jgi:phytoene dehydrogenase-like protein
MSSQTTRIPGTVAIVGAGLSGLYAAWLLERQGIRDYVLLEARDTLGGRIASFAAPERVLPDATVVHATNRFDMGPTWCTNWLTPWVCSASSNLRLAIWWWSARRTHRLRARAGM